jgi:hypothetical protein
MAALMSSLIRRGNQETAAQRKGLRLLELGASFTRCRSARLAVLSQVEHHLTRTDDSERESMGSAPMSEYGRNPAEPKITLSTLPPLLRPLPSYPLSHRREFHGFRSWGLFCVSVRCVTPAHGFRRLVPACPRVAPWRGVCWR